MQQREKNGKWKLALAALCLVVVAVGMALVWRMTAPKPVAGEKRLTIEVVHGDGSTRVFEVDTDQSFLGGALVEHGIVVDNQGDYGLYILTADGETADGGKQQWWCITKDGEPVDTGADATPITDGERYKLTLTTGW